MHFEGIDAIRQFANFLQCTCIRIVSRSNISFLFFFFFLVSHKRDEDMVEFSWKRFQLFIIFSQLHDNHLF